MVSSRLLCRMAGMQTGCENVLSPYRHHFSRHTVVQRTRCVFVVVAPIQERESLARRRNSVGLRPNSF